MFKGTKTRTTEEITRLLEIKGAEVNAATGYEDTCYYASVRPEFFETIFDLYSDMIKNKRITNEGLELTTNLENLYNLADDTEKAQILKLLGAGYVLDGNNVIKPTYKKAFGLLADMKKMSEEAAKSSKRPFDPVDNFGAFGAENTKGHAAFTDVAPNSSKISKWRGLLDEVYNYFAAYTVPLDFEAWQKVCKSIRTPASPSLLSPIKAR